MPSKKASKPKAAKPAVKTAQRIHVLFKGRVQGVGFRYTAERISHEIGVTGWVRNLPGGDVEMVAEGTKEELACLLDRIKGSEVGRHIVKASVEWQAARNEFKEFRVEFCY